MKSFKKIAPQFYCKSRRILYSSPGSGKFFFERARSQVVAKLLERLEQQAQSTIQIVAVRENNITPDGIGTSREAKRVTQAAAASVTGNPVSSV